MKKNNFLIFLLLSAVLSFFLSGCVTVYNPATQKKEIILIDTESEVAMGKDMDLQVQKKYKILTDYRMQQRLDSIGKRVGFASDRQDLTYRFKIINDKEFNAFTIPGGYLYVNSGLMNASTDDELACVVAHEIGHVAARHSVKKLQAALGYQLIMGIALGISEQQAMASAMDVVFNLASLGYSREDELLADRLAVKYAKKSGFDPYGMVTFFRKLQKEAEDKGGKLNIELFNSHPDLEKRIKNIEKEITLYN
ncbi:MAG: M48 family metallopeptidase [Candidatus Omnitrophota bacterium]